MLEFIIERKDGSRYRRGATPEEYKQNAIDHWLRIRRSLGHPV